MQNTAFYDLLAVQEYRNRFEYISRDLTTRDSTSETTNPELDLVQESESVALMINLAYLIEYDANAGGFSLFGRKIF